VQCPSTADQEFKPDAATKVILARAAEEARLRFMIGVRGGEPWWAGTNWNMLEKHGAKMGFTFQTEDALYVDKRGMIFFFTLAAPKKLGAATFYVVGADRNSGNVKEFFYVISAYRGVALCRPRCSRTRA